MGCATYNTACNSTLQTLPNHLCPALGIRQTGKGNPYLHTEVETHQILIDVLCHMIHILLQTADSMKVLPRSASKHSRFHCSTNLLMKILRSRIVNSLALIIGQRGRMPRSLSQVSDRDTRLFIVDQRQS